MQAIDDIFGAVRLGYLVIGSAKLGDWKRFGTDALGLHLATDGGNALAFRLDQHARRIIVEKDACEDVTAVGWQLSDEAALNTILDRLGRRGARVEFVDDHRAAERGVRSFHRFVAPKGLALELFTTPILDDAPLTMLSSGFNTGAAGMGHIALTSREPKRMLAFWQDIFDARISDRIEQPMGKVMLDVTFLRLNPRHHSVAIAATRGVHVDPVRTRVQHVNIEAVTLEDLSAAYERCKSLGYRIAHGVGQHPNDRELSFYVWTPSGFELEFGWNAATVDEATWQQGVTYPNISIWGHEVPAKAVRTARWQQMSLGLRSLFRSEYFPWNEVPR